MTLKEIPETVLKAIINDLENGLTEDDAAILNKSRTTYYRWKKEILKVNDKDEVVDISGKVLTKDEKGEWVGEPVYEFKDLIEEAKLKYKRNLIVSVSLNSVKSGRVGLEVLRRRFPKDWNVPVKTDLTSQGRFIGNVIVLPNNGRDNIEPTK